ncbi:MAG: DUF115 domain-containing protein [Candidatus Rhabdochlamydia sp.]
MVTWDAKKEKTFLPWISAQKDRYIVVVGVQDVLEHPQIYSVQHSPVEFYRIAKELIYLPFVYEDPHHLALVELKQIREEVNAQASDFTDQGLKLLHNHQVNLLQPFSKAEDLYGKFTQTKALVCGAGPSLDALIPFLKKAKDTFLIIGCGSGVKALLASGITPHLAVHVDMEPSHTFKEFAFPLFFQLRTDPKIVSLAQGKKFIMGSASSFPLTKWLEDELDIASSEEGGWTSTTRGVALAYELGCQEIYFAGMDFAYGASHYAKGVKASLDSFIDILLQNGKKLKTKPDWVLAAKWLDRYVIEHPDREWGVLSHDHLLMPHVKRVDIEHLILEPQDNLNFLEICATASEEQGRRVHALFKAQKEEVQRLLQAILARFQELFPKMPGEDALFQELIKKLEEKALTERMLVPIWEIWEPVFKRMEGAHPDHLLLHQTLFFQTVVE